MSKAIGPYEGKFVVLSYTESDYEGEDIAALVYQVEDSTLKPLYGVLSLPSGTSWNDDLEQYKEALNILLEHKVREVYVPWFAVSGKDFFGIELGYFNISEEENERGEIECWGEFGDFSSNWDFETILTQHGITIHEINVETMEVVNSR